MQNILVQNQVSKILKYFKYLVVPLIFFFTTNVANAFSLISDAEVETGIKIIVSPIIKAAGLNPDNVNIYILLSEDVNAFAINGNNIFINTGLITQFEDANVVKGVFAHELGHVTGGHIIRRHEKMKDLTAQTIVTSLLGVAAVAAGSAEAGIAAITGSAHSLERSMLRFSRENEVSADQAAFKYLERSENSPEGLMKIMSYFHSKQLSVDQDKYKYMMTHPMTKERIFALNNLKPWKLDKRRNQIDQDIYSRVYAKLSGFIKPPKKILSMRTNDPNKFSHVYARAIAYYRVHDFKKSISLINSLMQREPRNGYLYELKAQFLFEYGKIDAAVDMYEKAVSLHHTDNLIKLEYAVALINVANKTKDSQKRNKFYKEAIRLLNIVLSNQPNHSWAYRNLAIAYGRLGEIGASNLMLAEEAMLNGEYQKALLFTKIAKKKGLNKNLQLRADDIIKFTDQNKK